jgi:membrane protease YdiL (CAAX protease family)
MLFSVKNRVSATLLVLAIFVAGALLARQLLDLQWRLASYPGMAQDVLLGLFLILLGDGLLQGALQLVCRERYLDCFRALATYFHRQGPREIAAAGLLAGGGEELLFRGVVLEALLNRAGIGPVVAVGVSALLFGALHTLPGPRLAPFAVWAIWQGVLLGSLYIWTGSLLVVMLVHGAHDMIGFSLFARERGAPRMRKAP